MRGKPKTASPFTALRPADAPGKAHIKSQSWLNLCSMQMKNTASDSDESKSPLTDVKEETDQTQHTQHKCAAARKPVSNTDVKHYKRNRKKKVSKLWDANSEENKELRELNSEFCPFFLKEFKKSLPLSSEFMSSIQFHHGTKYKKLIIATFSELNLNVAILTFFSEQIKICSCLFFFYPVRNMLL